MTEQDFDAVSRLSAWLRDYGGSSTQVYQDDLACVLKIAAESAKDAEAAELRAKLAKCRELFEFEHNWNNSSSKLPDCFDRLRNYYKAAKEACGL